MKNNQPTQNQTLKKRINEIRKEHPEMEMWDCVYVAVIEQKYSKKTLEIWVKKIIKESGLPKEESESMLYELNRLTNSTMQKVMTESRIKMTRMLMVGTSLIKKNGDELAEEFCQAKERFPEYDSYEHFLISVAGKNYPDLFIDYWLPKLINVENMTEEEIEYKIDRSALLSRCELGDMIINFYLNWVHKSNNNK